MLHLGLRFMQHLRKPAPVVLVLAIYRCMPFIPKHFFGYNTHEHRGMNHHPPHPLDELCHDVNKNDWYKFTLINVINVTSKSERFWNHIRLFTIIFLTIENCYTNTTDNYSCTDLLRLTITDVVNFEMWWCINFSHNGNNNNGLSYLRYTPNTRN